MLGHKQECYQKYICIKNLTESKTPKCLTQYGYYHISPQDFNGASGDKVEGWNDIACMDQSVSWWGMGCLKFHG